MFRSVVRAERIGPTGAASVEWNTAAKRVMPSTISSYTMSAWFRPACGLASGWLSIFTISTGLVASDASAGKPVRGATTGATVVVGAGAVVLGATVVDVVV